ncbi:hypothetical protein MMC24_006282 [Lignoscripta atroalba]|nr:hypothetical protein [Lignoscripta atroalba]
MAFSTQFALSVEISKAIPFVINTASRGLIHLVRELQHSGSDIVTEHDLAEVLGRNLIEPRFASTFKTAVKHSTIHRLSGIAELVLEAGAGPTVRRSVDEAAYFSMVVQLSMLMWSHDARSLATALIKALERRNSGQEQNIPRFDILLGTLRCCRQQTSGFMWELIFTAVEDQLKGIIELTRPYESRPIPYAVLLTLLDAFTAVQRLPENHFLHIRSAEGVVTLVVWAHHILGLTVEVQSDSGKERFGNGLEVVSINCTASGDDYAVPSVTLLNESQDTIFQAATDTVEDAPLKPACRHPAIGYGTKILSLDIDDPTVAHEIILRIMSSCLQITSEHLTLQEAEGAEVSGNDFIPSKQRIMRTGRLLFPRCELSQEKLDTLAAEGCVARSGWPPAQIPNFLSDYKRQGGSIAQIQRLMKRLSHVIFALSMINNLDDCGAVPLSLYGLPKQKYQELTHLTVLEAYATIAILLIGEVPDQQIIDRAGVISSWGWSLCMSSLVAADPSTVRPDLAIIQGVPSRSGVRKEWILDNELPLDSANFYSENDDARYRIERCNVVAQPGEQVKLKSFMKSSSTTYFIGATDLAFEVFKRYSGTCLDPNGTAVARLGFRLMQELYWKVSHFPLCDHRSQPGDNLTVPEKCCVFAGFEEPYHPGEADPSLNVNGWVNLCLSAGDSSTRWILLSRLSGFRLDKHTPASALWLRNEDCCVECAVQIAKRRMGSGRNANIIL